MVKTATVNDETQHGKRIDALEAENAALKDNLAAVDGARVALEERVEKLEAAIAQQAEALSKGVDSMGLPRVV